MINPVEYTITTPVDPTITTLVKPICHIKKELPKPPPYGYTEKKYETDEDKETRRISEDGLGKIIDIIV